MARTNNLTNFLNDVSSAIKQKTGDSTPIPASEFDTEILSIETAGTYQTKSVTITENTTTTVTPDTGYDAIEQLTITTNVPMSQLQSKSVTITSNGNIAVLPDTNYDGMTQVNLSVNVPSGSGDIKLFRTEQAMQADPNPSEGDLAVVYREELTAVTADSEFSSCTFPNTVILPTAYSSDFWGMFRVVDESSGYFNGDVQLSASRFRFNGYGDGTEIRVEYESQDGITYTRTDGGEELQDFGVAIKYEQMEEWDDTLGYFMKIGGNYFEGMYEYKTHLDKDRLQFIKLSDLQISELGDYVNWNGNIDSSMIINAQKTKNILEQIYQDIGATPTIHLFMTDDKQVIAMGTWQNSSNNSINYTSTGLTLILSDDLTYIRANSYSAIWYSVLDLANDTFTPLIYSDFQDDVKPSTSHIEYTTTNGFENKSNFSYMNGSSSVYNENGNEEVTDSYPTMQNYILTKSQLDATADYVYGKTFYGGNGVENGTLINNISNTFNDVASEIYGKIQTYYNSLTPRVLTDQDKTIDTNTRTIPSKSDGVPLLDTSSVTNMERLFYNCKSLITIPQLDTSNATNMSYMFQYCTNLVSIPQLNTTNVTNMQAIFNQCKQIKTIPLLDTSSVTNMKYIFDYCDNLLEIPLLNTINVTLMEAAFRGCSHLSTIPLLNTSNVTSMKDMFYECKSLTTIPQLNTGNVTNMNGMFRYCSNLTEIPLLNTSKVTDMGGMFDDCYLLSEIPSLDTSNVTSMHTMFSGCTSLTTIPQLNTGNVTTMRTIFSGCTNLIEIPLLNTSKVTDIGYMFWNCTNLTTVPQLNTSNITNMSDMFTNCTSLSNTSLNNILAMCTNATKVTSNKTLKYIGLTSAQATTCQGLSNYSAFTAAGWTTGY